MTQTARTDSASAGFKARLTQLKKLEGRRSPEADEKDLIALVKDFPEEPRAFAALARVLMKQKKFDYAARAAEKAAALAPLEARAHTLLGVARMRNDDLVGASAAFTQALELDKTFLQALVGAAAVKMADENYDDALALCDRALDLDPSFQRAQALVARIHMKQGKPEVAAAELRQLLEQDASNDRALRAYLRLMRKEGRLDDVVSLAEMNLSTDPPAPQSVLRYARMVAFAGKPELAVEKFRKLIDSGDAREVDRIRFITALIAAGQLDEARERVALLQNLRVFKPLKQKLEGDIALASGNLDEAVGLYSAACQSARVEGLGDDKSQQDSAEGLARAWQTHTAKVLRKALRDFRSKITAKEAN